MSSKFAYNQNDVNCQFQNTGYVEFVIGEESIQPTNTIVIQGVSYVRYRVQSLLFSCFALSLGLIDLLFFFFKNTYFLHPSFDLLLIVGGIFLLLTTILAIKGK